MGRERNCGYEEDQRTVVGWVVFLFFSVTNRSVVLYYDKVKGVAFGDTLQDYINNYLRPENGADLSLLAPGYSNHFGSGYFNQNQVVLNQPTHQ